MVNDNCIFCRIAAGEIPSYTLYEDEDFRAILDASPSSKGHTLILPKSHADNLFSLDDRIASKVIPLAKKVATALKSTLNCDGVNVLQNNGEAAGQTVMHYHVHLIPRYTGDGETVSINWVQTPIDKDSAPAFVETVKERL